jgi:hypothetical protein
MHSLLALLTDVAAASAPASPELQLANPAAILNHALGDYLPAEQLVALTRMVAGWLADDPQALAEPAHLPMSLGAQLLAPYRNGLAELITLRGLLAAGPIARGRVVLRAAATFAALRRLSLTPADNQPPVVLVGSLIGGEALDLGHPPGEHPLREQISVAFDAQEPLPLLSIAVGSGSTQVPWQSERERWYQPVGQAGLIKVNRRMHSCMIVTERLSAPYTIKGKQLEIDVIPTDDIHIHTTTVSNERNRPLIVYLRASAPITQSA